MSKFAGNRKLRFSRSRDGIDRVTLRFEVRLDREDIESLKQCLELRGQNLDSFFSDAFWDKFGRAREDLREHEEHEADMLKKHEQTDDLIGE